MQGHLSLKKRIQKGTFWAFAGTVAARGFTLLASIIVARFLGREAFGQLGIIHSTIGLFVSFSGFGIGLSATRYIAELRARSPETVGSLMVGITALALILSTVTALVLVVLAPWLAVNHLASPEIGLLLKISAPFLFLSSINATQNGALAGFEAFRSIARINMISGMLQLPILVGCAVLGGLSALLIGLSVSMGISCFLAQRELKRQTVRAGITLSFSGCMVHLNILWTFCIPSILSTILIVSVNWFCFSMLVNTKNGYGEMGIFNAVNQWFMMILFLPRLFNQVMLPILSGSIGEKSYERVIQTLGLALKYVAIFLLPLTVLLCLASPLIMGFYGADFTRGWPVFVVAVLTAGLSALVTPFMHLVMAAGRMWVLLGLNCIWTSVFLGLNTRLVEMGALGLSLAKAAGHLVQIVLILILIYYILQELKKGGKDSGNF